MPTPADRVVFPDLVIHRTSRVNYFAGTETVARVPDLVIELLPKETAARNRGLTGANFLAYRQSGVCEYYYAWPDGREAAGFRLVAGVYLPIELDVEGFFASPLLGVKLRLVPAGVRCGLIG